MWCCCNLVGRGGGRGVKFFSYSPKRPQGLVNCCCLLWCDKLVVCAKRPIWGLSPASLIAFRIFPALSAVTGRVHLGQRVLWEYRSQILCQMCVFVGCQEIGRVCTVWFFLCLTRVMKRGRGGRCVAFAIFFALNSQGVFALLLNLIVFSSVTSDIHV